MISTKHIYLFSVRKNMVQNSATQSIPLKLPRRSWSLQSHTKNIDYSIEQLRQYGINRVIGYYLIKGSGVRETDHKLIPLDVAKELEKSSSRFQYVTLNTLLENKKHIESGRYKINEDGSILGFSDSYRKKKGFCAGVGSCL